MVRPPFWVCQRLIALAVSRWPEFHGSMLLHTGREPLNLPFPSLLDVIDAWWVDGAIEADIDRFHRILYATPGVVELDVREEWSDEETDASFGHVAGMLNVM